MLVANYTSVRQDLKNYIENVLSTDEPLIVTKKDDSVVMISLEKFNQMEKQIRNMEYVAKLQQSYEQIQNGESVFHDLIED